MNIIKVKLMDSAGKVKGRAYTYKSVVDVQVGDIVVADMAGSMKRLKVVETEIPQSEIEGLNYEVKLIDHIWDGTEEIEDGSVELRIEKETMPQVAFNYENIKAHLTVYTTKYRNLIVTEESLKGCKATQKEMAGLRAKLNRFRIDTKKKMSQPMEAFERQCKELIDLIADVENPIKEGIAVYDDKRREQKRKDAAAIRLEVIAETGLSEAYAKDLTLLDKYGSLGAKKADVKMDLAARAQVLKEKQDKEQELRDIIVDAITVENKRIKQQLSIENFNHLFDAGASTKIILEEVRMRAEMIYKAENPEPEPEPQLQEEPEVPGETSEICQKPAEVERIQEDPQKEFDPIPVSSPAESVSEMQPPAEAAVSHSQPVPQSNGLRDDAIVSATYQCTGTYGGLKQLSAWLRNSNIRYKAIDQRVIEP